MEEEFPGSPSLSGTAAFFSGAQRGACYARYGTRLILARPGTRLEANLSTPILGWATDGSSRYALVAQLPTTEEEARCSSTSPCALQSAELPTFSPARYRPEHAFFG